MSNILNFSKKRRNAATITNPIGKDVRVTLPPSLFEEREYIIFDGKNDLPTPKRI